MKLILLMLIFAFGIFFKIFQVVKKISRNASLCRRPKIAAKSMISHIAAKTLK